MRQILFTVAVFGLAISGATAQDLTQVTPPDGFKVVVDNAQVRVLHVSRGPHVAVPMHEHKLPFVVIYLKDDHVKITGADGKVADITHKAGDYAFNNPPIKHEELHLIDGPLDVVLVELKAKTGSSEAIPAAMDPVKTDPKHNKLELENDRVRIVRSTREGHSQVAMHQHPAYVTVALTDVQTRATLGNGTKAENRRPAGDIAYRAPVKHAIENLGDQAGVELQVELK